MSWGLNGADSADNQTVASSFITTSGILPPATYPQFTSWPAAKYDRPGGPFVPHTGSSYVYSQIADVSYKRLTRTFTVPAGGGDLSFWTSYNTEQDWDHLFVEVHTVGQNDWTTLPDANGHTTQATGESCKAENSGGWRTLHPWLDHYQTQSGPSACTPTGTTGAWNAASGDSGGWQNWSLNMSAYAGQQVEVSISYASDWATQGLGVFVDDVTLPDGDQHVVRDRPRRLDGGRAASGRPAERERLDPHDRGRLPGGRRHRDAGHDLHGLRPRGHLDGRSPRSRHGPRGQLPPSVAAAGIDAPRGRAHGPALALVSGPCACDPWFPGSTHPREWIDEI